MIDLMEKPEVGTPRYWLLIHQRARARMMSHDALPAEVRALYHEFDANDVTMALQFARGMSIDRVREALERSRRTRQWSRKVA